MTVEELPSISQKIQYVGGAPLAISSIPGNIKSISIDKWTYINTDGTTGLYTTPIGGMQPHNNVQPCIAVYLWKRTA